MRICTQASPTQAFLASTVQEELQAQLFKTKIKNKTWKSNSDLNTEVLDTRKV